MNREDLVLERLRAADPAPDVDRINPDKLGTIFSLLEERRDTMTTKTPTRPQKATPERTRWLRPVLTFSLALMFGVLAVGIGVFLFGGESAEDVVTPTETTAPDATTAPAPTTTPEPTDAETPIAPIETIINQPVRNMETILGRDGNPVFLGEVQTDTEATGALQLIHCTDPACLEQPEVVDVVTGIEWQGTIALAIGPEGYPLLGYRSDVDPDGTTFDAYSAEFLPSSSEYTVMYCADDACRNFESYELGTNEAFLALVVNGWAFTADGLPLYTYVLGPPNESELHLVACADLGCQSASDIAIDTAPFLRGSRFVHGAPVVVDDAGGVLVTYTASTPTGLPGAEGGWDEAPMRSEVRVAYCVDSDCSSGLIVTTLGEGLLPLPMAQIDGSVHIKYVSTHGDEIFDGPLALTSVQCHEAPCTTFTPTTSAPLPGTPGLWEDWTYDAAGRLSWALLEEIMEPGMVEGENGPEPGDVQVGTRLAYNHCEDIACSAITNIELGELVDADYWDEATVLFGSNGQPMVVYNAADRAPGDEWDGSVSGIRIVRPLQQ